MCLFFKIVKGIAPDYLRSQLQPMHSLRNNSTLFSPHPARRIDHRESFFPSCIYSWNNILNAEERNSTTLESFKLKIKSRVLRTKVNNFNINSYQDIKYINQLRVGLSGLNKHRFNHKLRGIQPYCSCGAIEDTLHFLRMCPQFHTQRCRLCCNIFQKTSLNLLFSSPHSYCKILLYGCETLSDAQNKIILSLTNDFITETERFR